MLTVTLNLHSYLHLYPKFNFASLSHVYPIFVTVTTLALFPLPSGKCFTLFRYHSRKVLAYVLVVTAKYNI